MNWESGLVSLGCPRNNCTGNEGLVMRPTSQFAWNAFSDDTLSPYLCASKCKQGYHYYPCEPALSFTLALMLFSSLLNLVTALKQCLKTTQPTETTDGKRTYGQALLTCARDGTMLYSDTCEKIELMSKAIHNKYLVDDQEYFLGDVYGDFQHFDRFRKLSWPGETHLRR